MMFRSGRGSASKERIVSTTQLSERMISKTALKNEDIYAERYDENEAKEAPTAVHEEVDSDTVDIVKRIPNEPTNDMKPK
ncbi:hypothetical protein KIN20_009112 [Parelaphostrongylus tenuis]|uniref:Uncharacterized protein n=1 Tax=Parelaphostrongylus tenuis TaxID=148309 RepID=A0AAD5MXF0_PARTN|nr:hypothetical protein KIN20_009112 [Parelaphostrongylus tenuis]